MNVEVFALDCLRHESHDLADQHAWDDLCRSARSEHFGGLLGSPPCSTFSVARSRPGGPPPLRGESAPEIYGLPGLTPSQKEQCRIGTLHALRAHEMAQIFDDRSLPWLAETPLIRRGHPSVFKLPEWLALRQRPTIRQSDPDQCQFKDHPVREPMDTYRKGTTLVGSMDLQGTFRSCSCPVQQWVVPTTGQVISSPHPPLVGTQRAYLQGSPPPANPGASEYLTRATAHYPAEFTWQLIGLLAVAMHDRSHLGLTRVPRPKAASVPTIGCEPGMGAGIFISNHSQKR